MATYDELARDVMDWSNRSTDVLSYERIRQCVNFAHDECYRTLRIAPLEHTNFGIVTDENVSEGYLEVPDDSIEFIQLRKKRETNTFLSDRYDVAEAKGDLRSLLGDNLTAFSNYAYVRELDRLWVYPRIATGETWELHYYRRLAPPNQRWTISEWADNFDLSRSSTEISADAQAAFSDYYVHYIVSDDETQPTAESVLGTTTFLGTTDPDNITVIDRGTLATEFPNVSSLTIDDIWQSVVGTVNPNTQVALPRLKDQWLRDENEKVLLFGALYHAFDYLDEPEQTGKFKGKFEQEIHKLNQEERMRQYSGGNLNINFFNPLI